MAPILPVRTCAQPSYDGRASSTGMTRRRAWSGCGPVRPSRSRPAIAARSSSSSSKSKTSMFSAIRDGRHRLRDHDRVELHVPAQHHLGGRAAVLLGEAGDDRVGEQVAALGERAHASVAMPASVLARADLVLLQVGVQLDLVDRRHDLGAVEQPAQVLGLEVGDADRADPAVEVEPLQRAPGLPRQAASDGSGQWIRYRSSTSKPSRSSSRRRHAGWRRSPGRRSTPCW